jgi:hypothetical protein
MGGGSHHRTAASANSVCVWFPWLAGAPACLPFFRSRHWSQEATLPQLLDQLSKIEWVVYAKAPFGGANQVMEYLGRYTLRMALSNDRLLNVEGEQGTSSTRITVRTTGRSPDR